MGENYWAVVCPEDKAPGTWGKWWREHCVALGWAPPTYRLHFESKSQGWNIARERAVQVSEGDIVIPYLNRNRFGIPGRVLRVAVSDDEWEPTVEKGRYKTNPDEAELGRRIHVEWLDKGVPPSGSIAVVPRNIRHANGEVHQAIESLNSERLKRFTDIIENPKNWKRFDTGVDEQRKPNSATPEKVRLNTATNAAGQSAALLGDAQYLTRARDALPLLVRQAEAHQTIFYSDLAEELKMPNPRNLNYVLGAIGRAVKDLSDAWKENIPPLQCVVVNKNTGLPGDGVEWFISDLNAGDNRTASERIQILKLELVKVFEYRGWNKVLDAFQLAPVENDGRVAALIAQAGRRGGVGEREDHRRLKLFVAENPSVIGLKEFGKGSTEHCFPSADRVDVVFQSDKGWVGVEVKGPSSDEADIVRGMFQVIKYAALRDAHVKWTGGPPRATVMLVISGKLPEHLVKLKNLLGVKVLDEIVVPQAWTLESAVRNK
jgi:hypothetical protein